MFKNYVAKKSDLEAIKEALSFVLQPEMKFVFNNLSKITKTLVVSYDSRFIYVWQSKNPLRMGTRYLT